MIVKTMCLSIIWYHAGLMPGWDAELEALDKKITSFVWKGSISKVARATLLLPREKGGLGLWNLRAKNNAFRCSWILKFILGNLNPILSATISMVTEHYKSLGEFDVPLWESRVDHSNAITKATGSKLFAELQISWAAIIRRRPSFDPGTLVAYSDEEEEGRLSTETVYKGKGLTIEGSASGDREVKAKWYDLQEDSTYAIRDNSS